MAEEPVPGGSGVLEELRSQRGDPYVVPTDADPVAMSATPLLGGPLGRLAGIGTSWWTPARIAVVVGLLVYALGFLGKGYCLARGWGAPQRYMYLCYSDIPILYTGRGIADGILPYVSAPGPGQEVLEYPVLTGLFMYLTGWVTRLAGGEGVNFFAVNIAAMAAFLALAIVSTARTVARRPWDSLMLALSPAVFLAAYINWDLVAVGLSAAAVAAWSRRSPGVSGLLLGLAISAKFYPLVLIGPVVLLCLLRRQLAAVGRFLAGAAGAWLAVNLPFMLANFDGWARFYAFSRERGQDFGSLWYALSLGGLNIPAERLNTIAMLSLLALCLLIAVLTVLAPRPPRLASLALLTVSAFVLTNKVYSPQYVLWVLPFAVLARPRWRDLLVWQAAEAAYFVGIWWYLVGYGTQDKGLPEGWYVLAVVAHFAGTIWLCALVVRDMWRPQLDPVRSDGFVEDVDDPGGGVLDGAPSIIAAQNDRSQLPVEEGPEVVVAGTPAS